MDDWTPLASSNLSAYRYDASDQTLQIRFHSGRSYSYADVPQSTVDGLAQAGSPGQYFNSNIKGVYTET